MVDTDADADADDERQTADLLEAALISETSLQSNGITTRQATASETHGSAPNPFLAINTAESEARLIALPLVRQAGRDLMEPYDDARTIGRFKGNTLNPAWTQWMSRCVLPLVEKKLGLDGTPFVISGLQEVLVCGTAGMVYSMESASSLPNTIGTVKIILPAMNVTFLLHNDDTVSDGEGFPSNSEDGKVYAIFASYLGVSHHLFIPKGTTEIHYSVVLSYNIVSTGLNALPKLPDNRASIAFLESALTSWPGKATEYPEDEPEDITWVLTRKYDNFTSTTVLDDYDRACVNVLLQAATSTGMKLFAANVCCRQSGTREDWTEPEYHHYGRYRYDDDEDEYDPADDEDPKDMTIDSDSQELTVDITWTADFESNRALPELIYDAETTALDFDIRPTRYLAEDVLMSTADSAEYDHYNASLEHLHYRSAIVIVPKATWGRAVAKRFSFRASALLDEQLWQGDEQGRIDFAEQMINNLPHTPLIPANAKYRPHDGYLSQKDKDRKEHTAALFEFALAASRHDLFIKLVDSIGTSDTQIFQRAGEVFKDKGNWHGNLVRAHAGRQSTVIEKIKTIVQFTGLASAALPEIMNDVIGAGPISPSPARNNAHQMLDTGQIIQLEATIGLPLLVECILPKLGNYHDYEFWYSLLSSFCARSVPATEKEYCRIINRYLPLVVDSYNPSSASATLKLLRLVQTKFLEFLRPRLLNDLLKANIPASSQPHAELLLRVQEVSIYLRKRNAPLEDHSTFFRAYFVQRILPILGPRPAGETSHSNTGSSLPPLARPCCSECHTVNGFLISSTRTELQVKGSAKTFKQLAHAQERLRPISQITVTISKVNRQEYLLLAKKKQAKGPSKWDIMRKDIRTSAERVKSALGPVWGLVDMATREKFGGGWSKAHTDAAKEILDTADVEPSVVREQRTEPRVPILPPPTFSRPPILGPAAQSIAFAVPSDVQAQAQGAPLSKDSPAGTGQSLAPLSPAITNARKRAAENLVPAPPVAKRKARVLDLTEDSD